MKKLIQTPSGFQIVDSWNPSEQQYFSPEELPTIEQTDIRNAYSQAITDIDTILAYSNVPVIDTLPKAQAAIRQIISAVQTLALIEKRELQFHKVQRKSGIDD